MFQKKKKSESLGFKSPRMTRCVGLVNIYRSWEWAWCSEARSQTRTQWCREALCWCTYVHTFM